ncbi:glycosyltransferase family 2 protein [Roseospira visakhapatnamensis]|uniref:Glycosyltransferase 2-like domain-containing protein n=1 Tax=Roseospira visakhapatnamensis TaxID=390880 RepID=A0A7W6W8W8_9PROT|nr:glycosyltransferase [Roseospira visakhapatnamensis]MBB4265248.1 hypothetical protein [Roseospira visakhapatnamensis]
MKRGRWISSGEGRSVTLLGSPAESAPLAAALRSRGQAPCRVTPPPSTRPWDGARHAPARVAEAVAARLTQDERPLVAVVGPPWWLGVAAQARAAALETRPARWLLWPTPDDRLDADAPPAWSHEAAYLDALARASASWIAPPGSPARATLPPEAGSDARAFARWLATLPHPAQDRRVQVRAATRPVTLGVVLVHRDRPGPVVAALDSLAGQTRPPDALVVVDAASTDPTARRLLRRRVSAFGAAPSTLIIRDAPSLGAARHAGVQALSTDWVLILDDDNQCPPNALATFTRAAATGAADVWTCWAALFHGDRPPPDPDGGPVYRPLGPVPGLAGRANILGDANLMIRRDAFFRLSGFDPDPATGAEDWDLLVRALLAGVPQAVIPRVLLWKRHAPNGIGATMDPDRARARVLGRLRAARIPV